MKQTGRGRVSSYLAGTALAAVASLALMACSTTSAAEPERPAPVVASQTVQVVPVRVGQLAQTLSYTGDVKAKAQVAVTPKTAGRIEELRVDVGSEVQAGMVIAVIEHDALDAQLRQAEAGLAAAKAKLATVEAGGRAETIAQAGASLDAAQQRLAAIVEGPRQELVAQAEANVKAAEARLQQLKNGPTAEQRRVAEMGVEGAKVKLHAANVQKDGDCNAFKPEYLCQASQANAFAAAYAVDAAQAQYDALVASPTTEQVAQTQAALDVAREQLRLAQHPYSKQDLAQAQAAVTAAAQQVELARRPFTAQDIAAARAGVEQATAAAQLVRLQLRDASVTAPIAGVVAERLVSAGSLASPQTPIVVIVGREVEVQVAIEESKIGSIAVGQDVALAVASRPGQPLPATVTSIAPTVDARTRTLAAKITPLGADATLRPGMFVQATIALASRQGALLLPKAAVTQRDGKQVAFVVQDAAAFQKAVQVGSSDDRHVEVLGGLADGEEVIVGGLANLIDGDAVAVAGR